MSLVVELPEEMAKAVEQMSRSSGMPAKQLVIDALSAHFPPICPELSEEFDDWELASEEDAARIEPKGKG